MAHFRTLISNIYHSTKDDDIEFITDTLIEKLGELEEFSNY